MRWLWTSLPVVLVALGLAVGPLAAMSVYEHRRWRRTDRTDPRHLPDAEHLVERCLRDTLLFDHVRVLRPESGPGEGRLPAAA